MSEKKEKKGSEGQAHEPSRAVCIFDKYDLKFGMNKDEVSKVIDFDDKGTVTGDVLPAVCARSIDVFFDHNGLLWQVKAEYIIQGVAEAEALLERMSQDFRFQTPSVRVAFDLTKTGDDVETLEVRYTEAYLKRAYVHHMLAVAQSMREAEEERAQIIKDKEEEDYIPTGPMMF